MMPDARDSALLVAGIVRDCATHIRPEMSRLAAALRGFRSVHWLLIESDSNDDTLDRLREIERRVAEFRFTSLGRLRDSIPLRTQRLALCRNAYLHEIRHNSGYVGIDFVLIADFDGTNRLITESAISSCWRRSDWDACTANQNGPYYDVWALRHPEWSPNDCWAQYRFLTRHRVGAERARAIAIHSRMIRLHPHAEWIEVESAFGGLAIYRRHALKSGEYDGLDTEGHEVCEHVRLHADMRADGRRIFVNPGLINTDCTEHTATLLLRHKMVRVAKRALRQALRHGHTV